MTNVDILERERDKIYLSADDLAKRWRVVSKATLRNWRSAGHGPPWTRIGRSPVYALDDIITYERAHRMDGADEEDAQ